MLHHTRHIGKPLMENCQIGFFYNFGDCNEAGITGFLGFCLSSRILNTRKHNSWKLDLFLFSGEEWEAHTLLGPLQRANLNHLNGLQFPKRCVSTHLEFQAMDQVLKPDDSECQALQVLLQDRCGKCLSKLKKTKFRAWVSEWTIPTERSPIVG
jgi:hypothetical protein